METPATPTSTPSEQVAYLCFSSWVQARHWAREHGIREQDLCMASAGARRIRGLNRRIIFVEAEDYWPGRRDYDEWRAVAQIGRHLNQVNGFETEIIHV